MNFFKEIRMKVFIQIYYILRMVTRVNNKRILFEAYWGKSVSCNPKAMMDYMIENGYDDYEFIVVYNGEDKISSDKIKYVNIRSINYLYYLCTSKYWVANTHIMGELKPKKNQVYMQTWHAAGAFKKFGLDIIQSKDDRDWEKLAWRKEASNWDYLLCSSQEVKDIYSSAFGVDKDIVYPIGIPRNDCFYDSEKISSIKEDINLKIGNKDNKKIILYAPTFRDNREFKLMFDFEKLYEKIGSEYVILLKLHPNIMDDLINIDEKYSNFVFNFSSYGEMQELLLAADLLITDYSSVIFDFSLTGNPIVLYSYDLDEYKNEIRGFYYEYEGFVPGPIVKTENELIKEIMNYEDLKVRNSKRVKEFAKKFNQREEKTSSQLAVELLLSSSK